MGHRANFVLIEGGEAEAFFDQWAGLGCAFVVGDGPSAAVSAAREFEPTFELLDWAFAEGGYLIDFDQKLLLLFGELDDPSEEFEDFDDDEDEEKPENELDNETDEGDESASSREQYKTYFAEIAPKWEGWLLRWDDRGVDAFSEHLQKRGIASIQGQQPSHPEDTQSFEFQA